MEFETRNIGPNIKRLRKEKGLRQSDLAEKAFVCPLSISQWELGKAIPQTGNFVFLCRALECTPNDLFWKGEDDGDERHQEDSGAAGGGDHAGDPESCE